MEELGIRQIFARSPQAKGRVERAAGTFQDRLVTELRLAGAATIAEANEVLDGFLPQLNEKFGVQAEQDCPAYRFLEQSVSLDGILCFKHRRKVSRDNTVKYNLRTLQLLPDGTRPTYAGVQVEVQEDLDGRLLVQYQGQTYPYTGSSATSGPAEGNCRRLYGKLRVVPRHQRRWSPVRLPPSDIGNGEMNRDLRPRKSKAQQHRIPTTRQRTLWDNVQQAKLRGLSLRAIARELGIYRNTVRKYALAESPYLPLRKIKSAARTLQPETGTLA